MSDPSHPKRRPGRDGWDGQADERDYWASRVRRDALGQRTFVAQPNFSKSQITRAEMSS